MESWVHLLPDSVDCLELLEGFLEFIQVEDALAERYPTAKDFCLKYLRMAQGAMDFHSNWLFSPQNSACRVKHNGASPAIQNTDLSEPWVLTPTRIVHHYRSGVSNEEQNPVLLSLMKFFNIAADAEGCITGCR